MSTATAKRCVHPSRLYAATILVVLISHANPSCAESPAVQIYANFNARIAHVESVGTLYDDTVERNGASGLLVGDRLVITNNHVIPPETNFKKLEIFVRLSSRTSLPLRIGPIRRDPSRDLAALELTEPLSLPSQPSCPVRLMDRNESVPVGSSVFVLGYPVDQDISISPGIISNKTGPDGRWQTSTPMNPGNSGGPAFGESGLLVGFAVGGIVRWRSGDESVTVQGVNFIIPTLSLLSSPLLENLRALPDPAKCWALASSITAFDISIFSTLATAAKVSCTTSVLGESTCKQQSPPRGPAEFARSHTVAQIKDDHPSLTSRHSRGYQEKFTAEDGYRISECKSQASSANNADGIACEISRDGSSAMFRYRLASGPAFDRYRGWLFTTVTLRQRRI